MPVSRSLRVALCVLFLCAPASARAKATLQNCDPYADTLAKVLDLRSQKSFAEAEQIVDAVLAKNPKDFHARYSRGLVLYEEANAVDPIRWNPPAPLSAKMATAFDVLRAAADDLPKMPAACARQANFFAILNTIGALYLNRGYFPDAEKYLHKAYDAKAMVTPDTFKKTLDNLGLLYYSEKKYDLSVKYYQEGSSVGSSVAKFQLPKALTKLSGVKSAKP